MTQIPIKELIPHEELMASGHLACPGCGGSLAMRLVLKTLGPKMTEIKERYKDDPQKAQAEQMLKDILQNNPERTLLHAGISRMMQAHGDPARAESLIRSSKAEVTVKRVEPTTASFNRLTRKQGQDVVFGETDQVGLYEANWGERQPFRCRHRVRRVAHLRDAGRAAVDGVRRPEQHIRDADIERSILVQACHVGHDAAEKMDEFVERFEMPRELLEATPFVLVGSVQQVVEKLEALRERLGVSHVTIRDADGFAPVVDALAGR